MRTPLEMCNRIREDPEDIDDEEIAATIRRLLKLGRVSFALRVARSALDVAGRRYSPEVCEQITAALLAAQKRKKVPGLEELLFLLVDRINA